jgi:uncharacterized membrane protein
MTGTLMATQTAPNSAEKIDGSPDYRRWLGLIVMLSATLGFIAAPWPLSEKAHAVLHGLCAQTPSHTLRLGGHMLPFDARMTGIYAGVAVAMVVIGSRTRLRFAGIPRWPLLAVMAAFVLLMAADGFNSFFLDMGVWHPYAPQNWLRLVTGMGAGIALGATLCYLIASTLWRDSSFRTPAISWRDLAVISIGCAGVAALFLSGWGFLYPIATFVLVASAVFVICSIVLLMLILLRETNNRWRSIGDMQLEGAIGILLGLLVIAMLAGGRFALEYWLGIPALA